MTTTTTTTAQRVDVLHPLPAALFGGAVFAAAMTAGEVFGLNSDDSGGADTSLTDIAAYAGLVLAAVALATWLGTRARSGSPDRLARYALGLAIASAVTFVAFWSGWPHVLAAVAIVSALEHRRRVGGLGAMSGIALLHGGVAFVATTVVCLVG